MTLDSSVAPQPHSQVAWELFDRDGFEIVIFDGRTGRAQRLNPSASAVWLLCDGTLSTKQIAAELVETFGLEPADAAGAAVDAIAEFEAAGWLDGSNGMLDFPAPTTTLLPRQPDPCGVDTSRYGWLETVELLVGQWRVGVRAGSERIAAALRERFRPHLIETDSGARTNFSLRRTGRVVPMYEVMNGGMRVARSRRRADALDVVDGLLGGAKVFENEPAGLVSVDIGLVVREGLAVLVDVEGLKCTDRRWALDLLDGSRPTWRVLVDPASLRVHIPPPLEGADPKWTDHPLAGIVLSDGYDRRALLRRAFELLERPDEVWLGAVARLDGRVLLYSSIEDARPAVASLIAQGAAGRS
jgi:hypothetical protein